MTDSALILDTNALSAAADHDPPALEIVARAEHVAIPVIVLGEYRLGIAQSRHRTSYESGSESGFLPSPYSTSTMRPLIRMQCSVSN